MLFSGTKVTGLVVWTTVPRRERMEKLIARATADKSKAAMSTNFDQRAALIGWIDTPAFFHLLPRLNFSGTAGLPRPSL